MCFGIVRERTVIVFIEVAFFHSLYGESLELGVAGRNFASSGCQLNAVGYDIAEHGTLFLGCTFGFLGSSLLGDGAGGRFRTERLGYVRGGVFAVFGRLRGFLVLLGGRFVARLFVIALR